MQRSNRPVYDDRGVASEGVPEIPSFFELLRSIEVDPAELQFDRLFFEQLQRDAGSGRLVVEPRRDEMPGLLAIHHDRILLLLPCEPPVVGVTPSAADLRDEHKIVDDVENA